MYVKNDFETQWREAFNIYIKYYGVKENRPAPLGGATKKSLDFFVGGNMNSFMHRICLEQTLSWLIWEAGFVR